MRHETASGLEVIKYTAISAIWTLIWTFFNICNQLMYLLYQDLICLQVLQYSRWTSNLEQKRGEFSHFYDLLGIIRKNSPKYHKDLHMKGEKIKKKTVISSYSKLMPRSFKITVQNIFEKYYCIFKFEMVHVRFAIP